MGKCEVCGNDYDKTFEVAIRGSKYVFDCFECAHEKLAPRCSTCQCRILGHGLESGDHFFCSAHCARTHGDMGFVDRHFMVQENDKRAF